MDPTRLLDPIPLGSSTRDPLIRSGEDFDQKHVPGTGFRSAVPYPISETVGNVKPAGPGNGNENSLKRGDDELANLKMAQSKCRGFSHFHSMVDLSSSQTVTVYQAGYYNNNINNMI